MEAEVKKVIVLCVTCLENFDLGDVQFSDDIDGICPHCGAPGPFMEEERDE